MKAVLTERRREPHPTCPICAKGPMLLAHDTSTVYIFVCHICQASLSVPKRRRSPAARAQ
jgi:hypothetical protein